MVLGDWLDDDDGADRAAATAAAACAGEYCGDGDSDVSSILFFVSFLPPFPSPPPAIPPPVVLFFIPRIPPIPPLTILHSPSLRPISPSRSPRAASSFPPPSSPPYRPSTRATILLRRAVLRKQCDIPEEYKRSNARMPKVDVMAFLGIRRAEPVRRYVSRDWD